MQREIRIGLLLAATSCLLAVLVDWVVEELTSEAPRGSAEVPSASADTTQAEAEAPQEDTQGAQAAAEGSQGQG